MQKTKSKVRIKGFQPTAGSLMTHDTGLIYGRQFVKCLEFIHDEFFTDLETVMNGVVEALTAFEEKCK